MGVLNEKRCNSGNFTIGLQVMEYIENSRTLASYRNFWGRTIFGGRKKRNTKKQKQRKRKTHLQQK